MNYTYILQCSDGTYYTGWTNDIGKRVKVHNQGKGAKYTCARRPVTLVYYEIFRTKEEAMRREWEIKHFNRNQKEKLLGYQKEKAGKLKNTWGQKRRETMGFIHTGSYSCLEMFVCSLEGRQGKVLVKKEEENSRKEYPAGKCNYRLLRISLEPDTDWQVELEDCTVTVAYLSETDHILDRGVRFLEYRDGQWIPVGDLGEWYDTPNREQYHFNAFKNWINDPNGLCWYKGYYHMYYQANPHSQEWDHMYWGHAASKDLVHWVHLPYVLVPQEEILEVSDKKGGAFSGCAVALEDRIQFYLTRHLGGMEEREDNTVQYQTMVESADSIHFGEERTIIEKPDDTFSFNFRDPKVIRYEGKWQMVIGTRIREVPSIVRYTSENMKDWKYDGVLLEEKTSGVYTFECPDFFPLGGYFTALGAWMHYADKEKRIQPTIYYLGDYADGKFTVEKTGLYDFGSNFYAVQSFEHQGRRIAIGWVSDFYEEHIPEEDGSRGAMAIPRELFMQDGKMYRRPVPEIYQLKGDCICRVKGQNLSLKHMNNNCYYARITFSGETGFDMLLGRSKAGCIRLVREGKQLRIVTHGVKSQDVRFVTELEKLNELEIFVDRRTVEVFANGGEEAGTKLFYQDGNDGVFQAGFDQEEQVTEIELYKMNRIWK